MTRVEGWAVLLGLVLLGLWLFRPRVRKRTVVAIGVVTWLLVLVC